MSKLSSEEFWNQQFDMGGNIPAWWFDAAFSLRTAADVLDKFRGPRMFEIKGTVTRSDYEKQSVGRVHAMLLAMATECLLKALWLKYGGTLAKGGKYYPIPKTTGHRLDQLANAVSQKGAIRFTPQELEHLRRASLWIESGRYPIPKNSQDNPTRHKAFIGDPFVKLRTLMQKLEKELGCKMNFESE
ncbi:MAG: hypothetical protein AAB433_22990 [Nitrospirota bacterium]